MSMTLVAFVALVIMAQNVKSDVVRNNGNTTRAMNDAIAEVMEYAVNKVTSLNGRNKTFLKLKLETIVQAEVGPLMYNYTICLEEILLRIENPRMHKDADLLASFAQSLNVNLAELLEELLGLVTSILDTIVKIFTGKMAYSKGAEEALDCKEEVIENMNHALRVLPHPQASFLIAFCLSMPNSLLSYLPYLRKVGGCFRPGINSY
ncbi:uncharacterized protein LOC124177275 [Neodiprion fabricii]|uniref:uncharacterized protein LOC124177275 n=1 Tax=Neodiprion fabricii TaxID=2872261 RepID=UPI001ED8EC6B|nr:uncharacterized protein LOC124177275 [Neodiprion fabricii]